MLAPLPLYLLGGSEDVALSLDLGASEPSGSLRRYRPLVLRHGSGRKAFTYSVWLPARAFGVCGSPKDELSFDAEMELDSPIELLDSLCFVFQRLLDDLLGQTCARLALDERSPRETRFGTRADHVTTLRFPVPMTESKDLMKMLYLELSENPPPTAVLKVFIHAEPVEPRRTQHGLFAPASPEAEKLETTLARVRHFVGKENVGSPYLLNTHRADRFVMHPFLPPPIAGTEP